MPSKLSTIFSAGGYALITADRDTELGRLCIENPGIAELCEPEDPNKLVESLKSMLKRAEVRSRTPNMIARNYAVERLERDKVLTAFADEVLAREI
jgi:colanic acid biosynthesis glycosyl transferase WcaI